MASSHKLKNANGDADFNAQDKSIDVRMPVDGRDARMAQHLPQNQNSEVKGIDYNFQPSVEDINKPFIIETLPSEIKEEPKLEIIGGSIKYDFDDILIVPKSQTYLKSRYNDIHPYRNTEFPNPSPAVPQFLPLMTAPMDSVVDHHNAHVFQKNKITVVLPRTANKIGVLAGTFNSYGLKDKPVDPNMNPLVLLDVANGHMSEVIKWCSELKKQYPKCKIMAGNIANPKTYSTYCDSGVIDYARIGIGNGNGCLTTQQTGVGYPMASLISECYKIKIHKKNPVKIVADGGMKNYSDIIKALALGADYVMIGSILSKALESSAPTYWKGIPISRGMADSLYSFGFNLKKEFRGMSTKQAQKALGNTHIKTSEGVVRKYHVEYTVEQWVENFEHYLRSAMSYSNAKNLTNFIGHADVTLISSNAYNRFKK
jgi:IMP dehydrogenase/GMP reductase